MTVITFGARTGPRTELDVTARATDVDVRVCDSERMSSAHVPFSVPGVTVSGGFLVVLGAAMSVATFPQPLPAYADPYALCSGLENCSIALVQVAAGSSLPWSWYVWPSLTVLGLYVAAVGAAVGLARLVRARRSAARRR